MIQNDRISNEENPWSHLWWSRSQNPNRIWKFRVFISERRESGSDVFLGEQVTKGHSRFLVQTWERPVFFHLWAVEAGWALSPLVFIDHRPPRKESQRQSEVSCVRAPGTAFESQLVLLPSFFLLDSSCLTPTIYESFHEELGVLCGSSKVLNGFRDYQWQGAIFPHAVK